MGISSIGQCSTFVDLLSWRAACQPEQRAFTYLHNGEVEQPALGFRELDRRARAIAVSLQADCAIGDRALLLYPPGLDLISAFLGCLYAGVVAVPAPLPDGVRLKRSLPRLQAVAEDAQAAIVLTDTRNRSLIVQADALSSLQVRATDYPQDEKDRLAARWEPCGPTADSLAYLQYTSGSTSTPKGVMVSHGNLMHHCEHIRQAWDYRPDSIAATWLPHFHDYGLVDGLLLPLYAGISSFLMSPIAFYMRPARWLHAISRHAVTHSQGPNFAFEHCVDKVKPEQRAGLDLSSWRVASNGSEPIALETMERFAATFGSCGFRRAALYPAYGLAEATLLVSTRGHASTPAACACDADALERHRVVEIAGDRADQRVRPVVSCGSPIGDTEVIIVDPDTSRPCPASQVGEIWVSSSGMALGYWRRREESARVFGAFVDGRGPFLRTGDLGFMRDRELYVTGRIKDVIIIRGRNHYPQDIELTVAQSHPSLRPGYGVAFGLQIDGKERLIVIQEVRASHLRTVDLDDIVGNIREAVSEEHELQVHNVLLVAPGTVPKTSSGKIQRLLCRQRFVDGKLERLEAGPAGLTSVATPVRARAECSPLPERRSTEANSVGDM
jgi:acyl-CoA synthetase (AMP-forming)/AMP-acid ligase II